METLPHFENLFHTFAMQYKIKVQRNLDNEREHLAYGVSWNNSQGENIKAYKYKWSQLGAVSVGFRVFFD